MWSLLCGASVRVARYKVHYTSGVVVVVVCTPKGAESGPQRPAATGPVCSAVY